MPRRSVQSIKASAEQTRQYLERPLSYDYLLDSYFQTQSSIYLTGAGGSLPIAQITLLMHFGFKFDLSNDFPLSVEETVIKEMAHKECMAALGQHLELRGNHHRIYPQGHNHFMVTGVRLPFEVREEGDHDFSAKTLYKVEAQIGQPIKISHRLSNRWSLSKSKAQQRQEERQCPECKVERDGDTCLNPKCSEYGR